MKKKSVSRIMLLFIVVAIVLFTAADFALQYFTGTEVSPTLTTAWFAFWGAEIVSLAAIKTSKVKHNYDQECDEEEQGQDAEDEIIE